MLPSLSPDAIRSLAPDPGAARAGETLAARRHWSAVGRDERGVWGLCQGSGANPYQVTVDLGGPAFRCSCPSRKFPCKHALGLMHLIAADASAAPVGDPPAWAGDWLAARSAKAEARKVAPGSEGASVESGARAGAKDATAGVPDAAEADAARAKRIAARERKVDGGLADLDRWLDDLVRRGLLAAKSEGYAFWDRAGARLVDAQAASLAREVRAVGATTNRASGWAESALERLGRLHLIVEAYRRQDALPDGLRTDVRSLVGWTVKEDEVPAAGDVEDRWLVVGRTVAGDDRLTTARTWLIGETTNRPALHLAFGAGGANPIPLAVAGGSFRATLRFYPSSVPLRVVAPDGPREPGGPVGALPGGRTIGETAADFASLLARNPFLTSWPVVLDGVIPVAEADGLRLRDATGATIAAGPASIAVRLLALAGGRPVGVFGLWSGRSIRILSALAEGRLVDLGTMAVEDDDVVAEPIPVPAGPAALEGGSESDGRGAGSDVLARAPVAWSRLVTAALIGTERTDVDGIPPLPAPFADPGSTGRAAERRLLTGAAVTAAVVRAGWLPPIATDELVTPAPPETRAAVGTNAAWVLRRILEERPELAPEWLARAREVDRRPPDDELPRLLALAGRAPAVRAALAPVAGPRARWLVAQLPELGAGLDGGNVAPDGSDRSGPLPATEDPLRAWEGRSTAAARAELIAELRAVDPAAAREVLKSVWDVATTEERALSLAVLSTGLGAADEPLLTRAWTDSRAEVRTAATDLLARLPGSAYATLAESIGRPSLAASGRLRPTLEPSPPAAWSDELGRLGVTRKPPQGTGERAWWLRGVLARVAPARWESWLGADPRALLDRAARSSEPAAIILGWVEAAERFGDARWAAAILTDRDLLERDDVQALDPFRLLAHLPPKTRDEVAAELIGVADAEVGATIAGHCPAPWSPVVTSAVTAAIGRSRHPSGYLLAPVRELARLAARRMPPPALDDLERILGEVGGTTATAQIPDTFDVIRLRLQLDAAFAAEARTQSRQSSS